MHTRLIALALVLTLTPLPTFAQSLERASRDAGAKFAREQRPAARGRNPHKTTALVLMGVGAGLVLWALAVPSEVSCEDTSTTFSCGTHANKGLIFAGLGAAGLGGYLYYKGERTSPAVGPVGPAIGVKKTLRF